MSERLVQGAILTRIGHYKAALSLASAIALTELFFVGFLFWRGLPADELSFGRSAIAIAIVAGLWIVSNIARWLGAVWYAAVVAMVVYEAAINESIDNKFTTYWVFALGLLCAASVWLLIISKGFREEFAALRQNRARYKLMIGRVTTVVLVTWVVVATARDVYRVILHVMS